LPCPNRQPAGGANPQELGRSAPRSASAENRPARRRPQSGGLYCCRDECGITPRIHVKRSCAMASVMFETVMKRAKELSMDEQRRLRDVMENWLANSSPPESLGEGEQIERELLAEGIIDHIPAPVTPSQLDDYRRWQPIVIEGKPVSETILEERR